MHSSATQITRTDSPLAPRVQDGRKKESKKTVAIGDTHGRNLWEKIIEQESDADKIIFIGDYWDSFDISYVEQRKNFIKILDFKEDNPERVVLLIGNHDYHYLPYTSGRYSGYQHIHAVDIGELVGDAVGRGLMNMAYAEQGYIFTHAGTTNTWLEENNLRQRPSEINELFRINPGAFEFNQTDTTGCGNNRFQSPIWVRPPALVADFPEGCVQVVGHTQDEHVMFYHSGEPVKLIIIDAPGEYLIINNGEPEVGYVKNPSTTKIGV